MNRNQKIIFFLLVLLGAALIFVRLTRQDMLGDDAHYAFRAIGYFDFMASEQQTTPVQWFGERPFWSYLSFHDHPPMYFLIHFIFFKLFGVSTLVARIPAALAGVGTLLATYFFTKRILGIKYALFTLAALSVSSYFIWTSRIGLLESIFTFFALMGLLFLVKGFEKSKYFVISGLFLAFSLLTKYTLFFILPGILVYLIWKRREVFRKKAFWLGVLVFAVFTLPIWIYNANLYATRGHFDVQIDRVISVDHSDWDILKGSNVDTNINVAAVFKTIADGISQPYFIIFAAAFLFVLYLAARRKLESNLYLPLLVFVSFVFFFSFVGSAGRWVGVISPFVAMIAGVGLIKFFNSEHLGRTVKQLTLLPVIAIFLFSGFYTLNTNHLSRAVGGEKLHSVLRLDNLGYNQLDKKITELLKDKTASGPARDAVHQWYYRRLTLPSASQRDLSTNEFKSLIIFDLNTTWFPALWTFERQRLYRGFLIMSAEEFLQTVQTSEGTGYLNDLSFESVYFVRAGDEVRMSADTTFADGDLITEDFERNGIEPEIIFDDKGREAFFVYKGNI